jgi:AcrR family transcriptional regulator
MADSKRGSRPVSKLAARRGPRADAVANRARLLEVAAQAFDRDGLSVSLDEIARRAGVGPGTVHRHFPTKAALIDATLADRVRQIADEAQRIAAGDEGAGVPDPTAALLAALTMLVDRGAASHALADRLRSESRDIDAAVAEPLADVRVTLGTLLRRAQAAGGVRPDIDLDGLDAVLAAAHALKVHPSGGDALVQVLWDGLGARS